MTDVGCLTSVILYLSSVIRPLTSITGQISLFRRETQHRGEPDHGGAKDFLDDRQAGLAGDRGDRLAIERILADVEIEGREIDRHELVERREDALEIEFGVIP